MQRFRAAPDMTKANKVLSGIAGIWGSKDSFARTESDSVILNVLLQISFIFESEYAFVWDCTDIQSNADINKMSLVGSSVIENGIFKKVFNKKNDFTINTIFLDRMRRSKCISLLSNECEGLNFPENKILYDSYTFLPLLNKGTIRLIFVMSAPKKMVELNNNQALTRLFLALRAFLNALSTDVGNRFLEQNSWGAVLPQLETFCDLLFDCIVAYDRNDKILFVNTPAVDLLGASKSTLVNKNIDTFIGSFFEQREESFLRNEKDLQLLSQLSSSFHGFQRANIVAYDGSKVEVEVRSFQFCTGLHIVRGLAMRKVNALALANSEYEVRYLHQKALTNLAPVGLIQLNSRWECSYVNDFWCELSHLSPEESVQLGWINAIHPDDVREALNKLRSGLSNSGSYTCNLRLQSPLGTIIWARIDARCLISEYGEVSGVILSAQDITDNLRKEKKLKDIAERDQLTGLVNRSFFHDRLEVAIQGIHRYGMVGLFFIDLDKFKSINDTFGHETGDRLLKEVAKRLTSSLRRVDTISRLGGDEFTVILTNLHNPQSINSTAEKLISTFNSPFILGDRTIYVTCSIGIAVGDSANVNAVTLVRQADAALYKAKNAGRNQFRFYTAELDKDAATLLYLKQSLKENPTGDFKVLYQPQIDVLSNKIVGVEALARWSLKGVEPISPDVFIRIIEDSGLIDEFSRWLFEAVFYELSLWISKSLAVDNIKISINISAKQLRNSDLVTVLTALCDKYKFNSNVFTLEVTETALIDDPEQASRVLFDLSQAGFTIALDDFGTGYSSLSHLRTMPLDYVKIDKSFIKDVVHDEEDAKIVKAILSLAKALGIGVVAEGVDQLNIKNWLEHNECFLQQGFYFSEPITSQELIEHWLL